EGARLRLPGRERRVAAPNADLPAALAPPLRRAAEGLPGAEPRHVRAAPAGELADPRPRAPLRRRARALRPQPRAQRPGRRARPLPVRRDGACGDVRRDGLPADRRAAVPADLRWARVLLVPAQERPLSLVHSEAELLQ